MIIDQEPLIDEINSREDITPEQKIELRRIYIEIENLLEKVDKDINLPNNVKKHIVEMRDLEFQLQENWNHDKNELTHVFWCLFDRCTCSEDENIMSLGIKKIFNPSCIFHGISY